jgi:signal transduction histidine kinase/ActR/RegA family two-component response regulator
MNENHDQSRIIASLHRLVNDQFYSMIRFLQNLPFGGDMLAGRMLRDLAQVHSRSSLNSQAFKAGYSPAPGAMTPAEALDFVFGIHVKEGVIQPDWVEVKSRNGAVEVCFNRDHCVYNAHCAALVCDGFNCMCVRRFFCEGIVKELAGVEMESQILTPRLDAPMCRFNLTQTTRGEEESARIIREIESSAADNTRLLEAVRIKTELLERQKAMILENEARAGEERKALDEKIQQTQKLESLGVLAGGIAHDFNNLLTAILGDCDLAAEYLPPDSPARGIITEIKTTARHAAGLSHQMLAYSGKGKFNILAVSVNDVIREMAYLLERSTPKKVEARYHLEESLPLIKADISQLRQVILNLVINAAEAFEGTPGTITISTGAAECDGECFKSMYLGEELHAGLYVTLEIRDTGIGMDKQTLERIFDPFFSTKFTGRGLGLSAVLGIIRGHKAAVKIDSLPGQGTSFLILFPAMDQTEPHPIAGEAGAGVIARKTGLALVVDDEEVVRNVGGKMLQLMGYGAILAQDGQEGLDIFKKRPEDIDFVLLDLTMPRMDGLECLKRLREVKSGVRVIITSGYDENEVSQLFSGMGAAGFLQKPFDLDMFRTAVAKTMGNA